MKKIISVMVAIVLVCALSLTAFAASSPVGVVYHKVAFLNGSGAKVTSSSVASNGTFTPSVDTTKGTLNSWSIYKADGTVAQEGVDFVIVSGSLTTADLSIKALSDVAVCANYNGVVTNPASAIAVLATTTPGGNSSSESPKTGDSTAVFGLTMLMLAAAGCAFVAKKQLAK